MHGLFGTLSLATRSLQPELNRTEAAGRNLANVNTPGYARRRASLQTSLTVASDLGPQGTAADATTILQIRHALIDRLIVDENSVRGSYESRQKALQFGQAALGEQLDPQATGAEGSTAAVSASGQHGLAEELHDLFNGFQRLSINPTSMAERQVLAIKAQNLATRFTQVFSRLASFSDSLDDSLTSEAEQADIAINEIAELNERIIATEPGTNASADDLRDLRQRRIEDLAQLVKIDIHANPNCGIDIELDGVPLVSGAKVVDTLESYDAGSGQFLVRTATGGTALNLGGGSMQGTIEARDNDLASLLANINALASTLISEVNGVHAAGFGLGGSTGEDFFTGSTAADIAVNSNLLNDPSRIQASGISGAAGDNSIALALAQLAEATYPALTDRTFLDNCGQTVANFGQALNAVNTQLGYQALLEGMLLCQRDSVTGVSFDQERTDLIQFQRAFETSAKLITTIDEMLNTMLNLKG
jgi:flagellar hook-associated protein 1